MLVALEALRQKLPEVAKDIKLNLQTVLGEGPFSPLSSGGAWRSPAVSARNAELRDATIADAKAAVPQGIVDDAVAAAVLMAMNNIYYRSRHMVGKPGYELKSPRLRMNRMMSPASGKVNFELFSLAAGAINGCEVCVKAHENTVTEHHGISEDQVNDVFRIAAVFHAAAVALEAGV